MPLPTNHQTVELSAGTLRYRDIGSGPTVVFVHGAIVDSRLWEQVAQPLSATHRVVLPEMPLGSHTIPLNPEADVSPRGVADLLLEFLAALDLDDVTIVGNDSGGAITQLAITTDDRRIGRLVLTNCDAFEVFPPKQFAYFHLVGKSKALVWLTGQSLRWAFTRNTPLAYGRLTKQGISAELTAEWTQPLRENAEIRRDAKKLIAGIDADELLAASNALADFHKPALIVWGRDDKCFVPDLAERLAETLPDAKLEWIDDATTFVSLDQPARLVELVEGFAG